MTAFFLIFFAVMALFWMSLVLMVAGRISDAGRGRDQGQQGDQESNTADRWVESSDVGKLSVQPIPRRSREPSYLPDALTLEMATPDPAVSKVTPSKNKALPKTAPGGSAPVDRLAPWAPTMIPAPIGL